MANNSEVVITGITPAKKGKDAKWGNWIVIDQSGEFYFDRSVVATIWLVGGGCDGTSGIWNGNDVDVELDPIPDTGTGTSYSGAGGDGGYVFTVANVSIPKNQPLSSVIAEKNDKSGTSFNFGEFTYSCDQLGYVSRTGGAAGSLPMADVGEQWSDQDLAVLSKGGIDGVLTPYGYVGSSGGGGAVCNGQVNASNGIDGGNGAGDGTNHRAAGTDATNYGCGGGGGAICGRIAEGQVGGNGKKGCIIIAYVVEQKKLIVQKHYKRVCKTNKTCNTDYYSSSSQSGGCCSCGSSSSGYSYSDSINISPSTDELEERASDLEKELSKTNAENAELEEKINGQSRVD